MSFKACQACSSFPELEVRLWIHTRTIEGRIDISSTTMAFTTTRACEDMTATTAT